MDCSLPGSTTMEFPRQEYWSEWSFPCPGDLYNPGNEPPSPVSPVLVGGFFTSEPPWRPVNDILLFSCSVVSYSFQPHGLQHARLPCPSPSPGACSNSCPLSWWCHATILSCHPLLLLPSIFPSIRVSFNGQVFASGAQTIGASASASVPPMNIQDWLPLGLIGLISLKSKGLSRLFSNSTVQKHQFFSTQPSLWSNAHIHTWLLEKQSCP